MELAVIEGATRTGVGKSQGYLGLAIRDEQVDGVNIMHTAWEPSQEEILRLLNGGKIIVSLIGTSPQPIMVSIGT